MLDHLKTRLGVRQIPPNYRRYYPRINHAQDNGRVIFLLGLGIGERVLSRLGDQFKAGWEKKRKNKTQSKAWQCICTSVIMYEYI